MSTSNSKTGKKDAESSTNKSRQPSETGTKPSTKNVRKNVIKPLPMNSDPAQLFNLFSKNYESLSQAMAKQFEDEENFSPFPSEDDTNTQSNPIFNYNLLEALESASIQTGEKVKEVTNGNGQRSFSTAPSQNGASTKPTTHAKRKIICPPQSLLNDSEIDFIRNKIAQVIKQNEGGNLPRSLNFFDAGDGFALHSEDSNKTSNGFNNRGNHNQTSIEIEFSPIPECKVHGVEDCDCPIFDEEYVSSHPSSRGLNSSRDSEGRDSNDDGPSCEFTFEYDSKGRLLPMGNNIEDKLSLMDSEAGKLKELQEEFEAIIAEENGSRPKSAVKEQSDKTHRPRSISSKSTQQNKNRVKRRLKREITDPLDDLKEFVKEETQKKLEKRRLLCNRQSSSSRNFYGLIPKDDCCLLCQYEAVFGIKPRYLVTKKAN
ncbi:hypothetical protein KGF57_002834 [Candida theae]|uniref:Uncharacterized protein n=1 Tax=Candida theae TaxID=1198502 RepID=A0AAD5BEM7_9ASCO|nr:uncharacterized protein KGF57_002834 [Candida theae]KAI5958026.1 hypothetical protein KGF57_002834 [Candida theae]